MRTAGTGQPWFDQTFKLVQQFGPEHHAGEFDETSWSLHALNGEPHERAQGSPPACCRAGTARGNVKWLAEVHLQEDRYLGITRPAVRPVVGVGGTGEQ